MDFGQHDRLSQARRSFLGRASLGLGGIALASLLRPGRTRADEQLSGSAARGGLAELPHFPAKAKRVIFLCMAGGPSQLETFDYKPQLARLDGQPMPESFTRGQPIAQLQGAELKCLAPQFKFVRAGDSGQEISELLPHTQTIADKLCIIRSLHTDQINHDPAHTVMNTGTPLSGRPSMGAWVTYGLGSACENLPGFVVLTSVGGRNPQPIASRMWGSGCLPGRFQGTPFHSRGDAVHYINNPAGVSRSQQGDVAHAVAQLNREHGRLVDDPEAETRIAQLELAFQMQMSVPELMDIASETPATLKAYGCQGADGSFAYNCLLARRLAERGVRFIHLYHRGWDHHNDIVHFMKICCGLCDQPTAALVNDLAQRGMLDDTLIVWGGEFGRTPMFQGNKGGAGRDHHMRAFTMWLAGAGIKPGITYGETDELGYHAIENRFHVRDLHATLLQQLGIDHRRFSVPQQGLDVRLTGVEEAHVPRAILA
jgi:hypothetical protein